MQDPINKQNVHSFVYVGDLLLSVASIYLLLNYARFLQIWVSLGINLNIERLAIYFAYDTLQLRQGMRLEGWQKALWEKVQNALWENVQNGPKHGITCAVLCC